MRSSALPALVGALCYGLSTIYEIRFTNRTTVPTASALAPAVCLVGLDRAAENAYALVAGPLVVCMLSLLAKSPLRRLVGHLAAFGLVLAALQILGLLGTFDLLTRALVGGAIYLGSWYLMQRIGSGRRLLAREDHKTWLMLHGVLLCACGLTALGVGEMDWPAFIAMAFVLVLTKKEFESFAMSRTAYEQTINAVQKLKSLEPPLPLP